GRHAPGRHRAERAAGLDGAMPAGAVSIRTRPARQPVRVRKGVWNPTSCGEALSLSPSKVPDTFSDTGGANFVFADRHAQFIAYSGVKALPALATRAGRDNFGVDDHFTSETQRTRRPSVRPR